MKPLVIWAFFGSLLTFETSANDLKREGSFAETKSGCPTDLMIIIDSSGSTRGIYDREKTVATNLIQAIDIGPSATRVGLLHFSSHARVVKSFAEAADVSRNSAVETLKNLQQIGAFTNVLEPLQLALTEFTKFSRTGSNKIIVLITDGHSQNTAESLRNVISELNKIGAFIFVGTASAFPDLFEMEIYTAGNKNQMFLNNNVTELPGILSSFINRRGCLSNERPGVATSGGIEPDRTVPDSKSGRIGLSQLLNTQPTIKATPVTPSASPNVSPNHQNSITASATASLLSSTSTHPLTTSEHEKATTTAITTAGSTTSRVTFKNIIVTATLLPATTVSSSEVQFAVDESTSTRNNITPETSRVPTPAVFVAATTTAGAVETTLSSIPTSNTFAATTPAQVSSTGFNVNPTLTTFLQPSYTVSHSSNSNPNVVKSASVDVPGLSLDKTEKSSQRVCSPPTDLMIVFDNSGSVKHVFAPSKQATLDLVSALEIGPLATRVALIHYSSNPLVRFTYEEHATKNAVLNAVGQLEQHGGFTRTEAALQKAFEDIRGHSRSDAKKIMLLLTDGHSQDLFEALRAITRRLIEIGVVIFVGTVSESVGVDEFFIYANGNPAHMFTARNISQLPAAIRADINCDAAPPSRGNDGQPDVDSRPSSVLSVTTTEMAKHDTTLASVSKTETTAQSSTSTTASTLTSTTGGYSPSYDISTPTTNASKLKLVEIAPTTAGIARVAPPAKEVLPTNNSPYQNKYF